MQAFLLPTTVSFNLIDRPADAPSQATGRRVRVVACCQLLWAFLNLQPRFQSAVHVNTLSGHSVCCFSEVYESTGRKSENPSSKLENSPETIKLFEEHQIEMMA